MKRKFSLKTVSLIMSLVICFVSLPMAAFAVEADENISSAASSSTSGSTASENPIEIQREVMEMTELREENVKHFRLEDGTYTAVQYELPVHYLNENGEWQDIDNTLSESGSEYATSSARVKFAKKVTGNGNIFTLHEHNRKITMNLDGAKKKTAGVITNTETEHDADATQLQKMTTLDKLSASIIYEDVLDGVDLEYVVISSNIKENIIVKQTLDSYTFSFTIALNNLDAEILTDGSVNIFDPDTNESVYIIPKGFMYDANGKMSDSVTYLLANLGNGKYTFTVSADPAWINSADRAFPVTIDPPIYTVGGTNVEDTYINRNDTSSSNGSLPYLKAGGASKLYWKALTLPALPDYAYIADAFFHLSASIRTYECYLGVYQVVTDWSEWIDGQFYDEDGYGEHASEFSDFVYTDMSHYGYEWNITDIVKSWYEGADNYGIVIAGIEGYPSYEGNFHSSESSSANVQPKLYINYRDLKGVEDYWSYASHSVGDAGNGSINLATGKLAFAIPLLSTYDNIMPINVSLVYNADLANKYYTHENASVPYTKEMFGYGFKLNICETIVERTFYNKNGTTTNYYIWADSDGTEHFFFADANGVYRDEDGLKLTLVENTNNYIITASDHSTRTFTKYTNDSDSMRAGGVLTVLTDKNGNAIEFEYDVYDRLTWINLKPYDCYLPTTYLSFSYNDVGMLKEIENWGSDEKIILYYSSTGYGTPSSEAKGYLRTVERVCSEDNYISEYSYNNKGHFTFIRDDNQGYQIHYSYYSDNRVGVVSERAGQSTLSLGQSVNIQYYNAYTIVRNSGQDDVLDNEDDILTNYSFDSYGRPISVYSTDASGTIVYGASSGEYVSDNENAQNQLKSSTVANGVSSNYLINGDFETIVYRDQYEAYITEGSLSYWYTTGTVTSESSAGDFFVTLSATGNSSSSIYQYVYLPEGEYTLSAQVDTINTEGATIVLQATSLTDSSHVYTSTYNYGDQKTVSLRFQSLTSGGEKFKISISISSKIIMPNGITVDVDSVMLSNAIGTTPYDMVTLGSFEPTSISSSGSSLYSVSNFWTASSSRVYVSSGDSLAPSDNVLNISGFIDEENYASQVIFSAPAADHNSELGKTPEQTFQISGFARGTQQSNSPSSAFRLRVEIKYVSSIIVDPFYNGVRDNVYTRTVTFDFNPSQTKWQFLVGTFTISPPYFFAETGEYGAVESITVYCDYFNHPGDASFDNIMVTPVDSNYAFYSYNENGFITHYRSANKQREWYMYDEYDNLVKTVTNDGDIVEYSYDENHNIISETYTKHTGHYDPVTDNFSSGSKKYLSQITYEYNKYGLVTKTNVAGPSGGFTNSWVIQSTTTNEYETYQPYIFGVLTSSTDSLGNQTKYFYDPSNGNILAIINPDGTTGTVYNYDSSGRVAAVFPASFNGTSYSEVHNEYVEYTYNNLGRLQYIFTATSYYEISYDAFGNTDHIKAGGRTIVDYTYNPNNGKLNTITYANGFVEGYVYDALDRISEIWYNGVVCYTYEYDVNGNLYKVTDVQNNTVLLYGYDNQNRLVQMLEYNKRQLKYNIEINQSYDTQSRLQNVSYKMRYGTNSIVSLTYNFAYSDYGSLSSTIIGVNGVSKGSITYEYDSLQRITDKTTTISGLGVLSQYEFYSNANGTSTLVSQYESTVNGISTTYNYTYDANSNITQITDANNVVQNKYYYDDIGQLVREDNRALGKTYVYTYDLGGNRVSKITYDFTIGSLGSVRGTETYTYACDPEYGNMVDWLINLNGTEISYDNVGNPLNYVLDGKYVDFTWEGRQLVAIDEGVMDAFNYAYEYNDEGIRTSKTLDGVEYKYTLNGSQIVSQEWGDKLIVFFYDESGSPIGYAYRTTSMASNTFYYYVYEKNLQGDIVAVYNTSGTKLVSYTYDAWGNVSASNINVSGTNAGAQYNPFRYRGYYYDEETKLYYLNSRYYDPSTGRFLNADGYLNANGDLIGFNMFAYCSNNPVMGYDPYGTWDWSTFAGGVDLLAVGIAAMAISLTILTCGGAAPAMVAIAATTLAVGTLTTINGVAEVVEAGTGYNFVTEAVFNGNERAYGVYRNVTKVAAEIGTAICSIYYAANGGNVCFVAGTLIATAAGHIGIENIQAGDWVWATNPETGETELKQVVQTFVSETSELVHLTIGDEIITATPTHPFYVPNKGWTRAIDLRAGDILVTVNGEYVILERIQHEILEAPVTVYNFEVEDFHTYYVSDSSVLVHNKCAPKFDDDQEALLELAKENRHGVTRSDGELLVQWANEYGISNHKPMVHSGRSGIWSTIEHIKIKNLHIPIFGG